MAQVKRACRTIARKHPSALMGLWYFVHGHLRVFFGFLESAAHLLSLASFRGSFKAHAPYGLRVAFRGVLH